MMSLLYDEDVIRKNYMKEVIGEAEERGEKRGEIRGEKRGKDKGRTQQAMETAIKLKEKGFSFEDIAEVVGFSVDEVREWIQR